MTTRLRVFGPYVPRVTFFLVGSPLVKESARGKNGKGTAFTMVYFKSCRRCSGDRVLDEDIYGWYMLCLACGYVTYPELRAQEPRRHSRVPRTA